ncbi:MAG: hypothetical protein ACOYLQ_15080 [Hyphomicrobiaceae bacterium]
MRRNSRWLWRGIGAVTAGAALYAFSPDRPGAPTLKEPQIGTLRIVDHSIALPELKLWGAGPPMDLQWRVVAAVPPAAAPEEKLPAEVRPVRKTKAVARPAQQKPVAEATDWRHDLVYNKLGH